MPKVTFIIDGEATTVEFQHGQLPYSHHGKPESFLDVAKNLDVPLEHACGGSCACTTCHVIIREGDRKSTRLNSSHSQISYAVFCLKKKKSRHSSTLAQHPVLDRPLAH